MRIVIGADHAGVELKGLLHKHLQQLGWDVVDVVRRHVRFGAR